MSENIIGAGEGAPSEAVESSDVFDNVLGEIKEPEPQPAEPAPNPAPTEEPKPEDQKPAEPQPQPKEPEPPKSVPLATFLEMRDKERQNAAKLAELEAQLNKAKQTEIDPFLDPDAAMKFQAGLAEKVNLLETQLQQQRLYSVETALSAAQKQIGEEAFNEAYAAAKANPQVAQYILNHPSPGEAFLEFHQTHQRQKLLERIPSDKPFEDWIREEAAKLAPQGQAAPQQTQPQVKPPLPSLAGAKGGAAPSANVPPPENVVDDLLS